MGCQSAESPVGTAEEKSRLRNQRQAGHSSELDADAPHTILLNISSSKKNSTSLGNSFG